MFYVTQDGAELNEDQIEAIKAKIEDIFDTEAVAKDVEDSPQISIGTCLDTNKKSINALPKNPMDHPMTRLSRLTTSLARKLKKNV